MKKRLERLFERLVGRINPDEPIRCDYKECLERGEHIICLYDKFKRCDVYIRYRMENGK
jgi:hypothetical protein